MFHVKQGEPLVGLWAAEKGGATPSVLIAPEGLL